MVEPIFKEIFSKLTEPTQIISMGVIVCLFLIVRMMIGLLNRKEDILERLVGELIEHGKSVTQAVTMLEILVSQYRRGK